MRSRFDPSRPDVAPRLSIIEEIRRQRTKHVSELGVRSRRGVNNIKAVWAEADPAERDYWSNWYYHAHDDVQDLASAYDLDVDVTAAVVATLSPGNKWPLNLVVADKIIRSWKNGEPVPRVAAYPRNVIKAYQILDSNTPSLVGPKVSVFYNSLVDPHAVREDLVLDSHAINIWLGRKTPLKETPTISNAMRSRIESDYQRAARELGVDPQALQAVTWYVWKYTTSERKRQRRSRYNA